MSRCVSTKTHAAFITIHRRLGCAIIEIYEKVWLSDGPKDKYNYKLANKVSEYETLPKGATASASREIDRIVARSNT